MKNWTVRCRTSRGRRGWHVRKECQRKLGTTRGSPRRSRTAKASRISRSAVKSRCACEWGGWGRLSDDGPGQHNPDSSEDPWGCGVRATSWRCTIGSTARLRAGSPRRATKCTKGGCKPGSARRMSGADLNQAMRGKAPSDSQPSSRTGENPPYGMLGGIEETSASFEARSAPRSYPTGLRPAFDPVKPGLMSRPRDSPQATGPRTGPRYFREVQKAATIHKFGPIWRIPV